MANQVSGTVRRIDFEPKSDFLQSRIYAHVFLTVKDTDAEIDMYTEDPMLEAAFLTAWRPLPSPDCVIFPPVIEVHYEERGEIRKAVRVVLDYSKSR